MCFICPDTKLKNLAFIRSYSLEKIMLYCNVLRRRGAEFTGVLIAAADGNVSGFDKLVRNEQYSCLLYGVKSD